jgi:predicted metal-dependent peptidase
MVTFREILSASLIHFYQAQPFYGSLLFRITFKEDYTVATACLRYVYSTKKYEIGINPIFFSQLKLDERCELLLHEACHFTYSHHARFKAFLEKHKEYTPASLGKLWNIAGDAVINSHPNIKNLVASAAVSPDMNPETKLYNVINHEKKPGKGVTISALEESYKFKIPKDATTEIICEMIIEKKKEEDKINESLESFETTDEHDNEGSSESDSHDAQQIKKKMIREALKEAKKARPGAGIGLTSREMSIIESFLAPPKVKWGTKLRNLIANGTLLGNRFDVNFRKPSRNWMAMRAVGGNPPISPSMARQPKPRVLVCLDISGSIGNDMISKTIFPELIGINSFASIDLCQWTCSVHSVAKFDPKASLKREGSGGTDPNCIFEYIKNNRLEHTYQMIVIISDMVFFNEPHAPVNIAKQCIWVNCEPTKIPYKPPFGSYVEIDAKNS